MRYLFPKPIEHYRGCAVFETAIHPFNANKTRCVFAVITWANQPDKITVRYSTEIDSEREVAIRKLRKLIDRKLKALYS